MEDNEVRLAIDILDGMFPDKILNKINKILPLENIAAYGIKVARLHVEAALQKCKDEVAKDRLSDNGLSLDIENRIINIYPLNKIN